MMIAGSKSGGDQDGVGDGENNGGGSGGFVEKIGYDYGWLW